MERFSPMRVPRLNRRNNMNFLKTVVTIFSGAILLGAALCAQTPPPDFSGVYYPLAPFGRGAGGGRAGAPAARGPARQGPPPRPTSSAPLSDGSQGRAPDAPSLTPEYMAKWEVVRKSRIS